MFEPIVGMIVFCLVAALAVKFISGLFFPDPAPTRGKGKTVSLYSLRDTYSWHQSEDNSGGDVRDYAAEAAARLQKFRDVSETAALEDFPLGAHVVVNVESCNALMSGRVVQNSTGAPVWATLGKEWVSTEERTANLPAAWINSDVEIIMQS